MCQGPSESQRGREGKEKWQTCWCCRNQRRACRIAQALAKKLEQTSYLSRSPDHEMGESQGEREPHLGEKEQIRAGFCFG